MPRARLLIDPPLSGPVNMARDEALLETCRDADDSIRLRFYAWSPATISLGYFQDLGEYESLAPPARDLAVVRRTTGGGAILHDLEVTYSLVIPIDHPLVAGRPNNLYRIGHQAIIAAIGPRTYFLADAANAGPCDASAQRGPFFCFARRHGLDVVTDGPRGPEKIAGSAQRRTPSAILQHGSIILDSRFPQQPAATWRETAGPIDFDSAVARLVPAFEAALDAQFYRDDWREDERQTVARIEPRYAGDAWTRNRER